MIILKNIRNVGKIEMQWLYPSAVESVFFDTIYSQLSYSSSKVQYFAEKNSPYYTFFPELKRHSLAKIVNLGFSV